jgi:hypothetical protein
MARHLLVIFIELHKTMTSLPTCHRFLQFKKERKENHQKPKEDDKPYNSLSYSTTQEKKP